MVYILLWPCTRHLDKGMAGAGRPPSLLVVAMLSAKLLTLLLNIIRKPALATQLFCIYTSVYLRSPLLGSDQLQRLSLRHAKPVLLSLWKQPSTLLKVQPTCLSQARCYASDSLEQGDTASSFIRDVIIETLAYHRPYRQCRPVYRLWRQAYCRVDRALLA